MRLRVRWEWYLFSQLMAQTLPELYQAHTLSGEKLSSWLFGNWRGLRTGTDMASLSQAPREPGWGQAGRQSGTIQFNGHSPTQTSPYLSIILWPWAHTILPHTRRKIFIRISAGTQSLILRYIPWTLFWEKIGIKFEPAFFGICSYSIIAWKIPGDIPHEWVRHQMFNMPDVWLIIKTWG